MSRVDSLPGVSIFKDNSFFDNRGQLFTIWEQSQTPDCFFNHDKVAISQKNVLRGLHTDKSWKLITCIYGCIQLIVVDFNIHSENYLNHLNIIINAKNKTKTSVLVPPGFLNGHLVLSNQAVFHYKWSYEGDYPDVNDQITINWADPKLKIEWLCKDPIISDRDKKLNYV